MHLRRSTLLLSVVATLAITVALPAEADPPPAPWVARDIGPPAVAGATDVDASGVWTIRGSGINWGDADQFHFAYQAVKGDASISARFLDIAGGDEVTAKVGLMVRENASPGSANLYYCMAAGAGLLVTWRSGNRRETGGFGAVGPSDQPEANLTIRLQRVGNEVSGFYSRGDSLWVQAFEPVPLPTLQEEALIGLAVSSLQDELTTGKFDQVQVEAGATLVTGVTSCGGDQKVLLQWRPLKNATGYSIYRGPKGAASDQLVKLNADPVAGGSFTDTSAGLVNGGPQTYAVAALFPGTNGNAIEGPRVAVPASPAAVPPGWIGCSLMEGLQTGAAAFDAVTSQITLRGSGLDYASQFDQWLNGDQGYFVSQRVDGDAQITVKTLSKPTPTNDWARAGLMIRESLDSGARALFLGPTAAAGLFAQWRSIAYAPGAARRTLADTSLELPITLRLTRTGNTITAEYSLDDGQTFQMSRAITFAPPLPTMLHLGLYISADDRSQISEARFSLPEIRKL